VKSFLLALCLVIGIGAMMASSPSSPSPSQPLSERDKAWQRLAADVTPAQIEDMKRTAEHTGMEFKKVWGYNLAFMACKVHDPLLCPPTETKTKKEKKR
jgi:hypothetical protein